MSMFSKLMGRVLGKKEEDILPVDSTSILGSESGTEPVTSAPAGVLLVDVEANFVAMARDTSEELDWKRSIVDLLKLAKMDSSYGARKQIALELGYTQDQIDIKGSSEMNIWLHKQVMKRLIQNGGKVPDGVLV